MKRLTIALVILVAGLAIVGFYEGWFKIATEKSDHKASMNITVDKDKIHEDSERGKQELGELGKEFKEKTKQGARDLGRSLQKAGSDERAPSP
jgi:hypothetical protein